MSLKPLQTHFSAVSSLYAPYTTTGGGGGGGGGPLLSTSELLVSSLVAGPTSGGQLAIDATQGVFITAGPGVFIEDPAGLIDFQGGLGQITNVGALTGVSSINGAAYPPAGGGALLSTTATSGQNVGSVIQAISGTIPTTGGEYYMASLVVDGLTQIIGTPTDGDHCSIICGTEVLGTIDCARFSTMYVKGNPRGFAVSGPIKAPGATTQFFGLMSPSATCSTNIVVSNALAFFQPL